MTISSLHNGETSSVEVELEEGTEVGVFYSTQPVVMCEGEITSSFEGRYGDDYLLARSSRAQIKWRGVAKELGLLRSVVLGHSLAAGFNALTLRGDLQEQCFGSMVARCWGQEQVVPYFKRPGYPRPKYSIESRTLWALGHAPGGPGKRKDPDAALDNFAVPGAEMAELLNPQVVREYVPKYSYFDPERTEIQEKPHDREFRALPKAILTSGSQIDNAFGDPEKLPHIIMLMCGANDLMEGLTGFPYGDPDAYEPKDGTRGPDRDWSAHGNPTADGKYLFKPEGGSFVTHPNDFEDSLRDVLSKVNQQYEDRVRQYKELGKPDVILFTMADILKAPFLVPLSTPERPAPLLDFCYEGKYPFRINALIFATKSIFRSVVWADPDLCEEDPSDGLVSIGSMVAWSNYEKTRMSVPRYLFHKGHLFMLPDYMIVSKQEQQFVTDRRKEINNRIRALAVSDAFPNLRIHVIDLASIYGSVQRPKIGDREFSLDQGHLSPWGHRKLAKVIAHESAKAAGGWIHGLPWGHPLKGRPDLWERLRR